MPGSKKKPSLVCSVFQVPLPIQRLGVFFTFYVLTSTILFPTQVFLGFVGSTQIQICIQSVQSTITQVTFSLIFFKVCFNHQLHEANWETYLSLLIFVRSQPFVCRLGGGCCQTQFPQMPRKSCSFRLSSYISQHVTKDFM